MRHHISQLLMVGIKRWYYFPSTKLWEGNVLSCVCLSVSLFTGGLQVIVIDHPLLQPKPRPPSPYSHTGTTPKTCSNTFTWTSPYKELPSHRHVQTGSWRLVLDWKAFLFISAIYLDVRVHAQCFWFVPFLVSAIKHMSKQALPPSSHYRANFGLHGNSFITPLCSDSGGACKHGLVEYSLRQQIKLNIFQWRFF